MDVGLERKMSYYLITFCAYEDLESMTWSPAKAFTYRSASNLARAGLSQLYAETHHFEGRQAAGGALLTPMLFKCYVLAAARHAKHVRCKANCTDRPI